MESCEHVRSPRELARAGSEDAGDARKEFIVEISMFSKGWSAFTLEGRGWVVHNRKEEKVQLP